MNRTWWKESVVYQIYPRSFCDSNGDGVGDLRGIISKLDYLHALGVDVVWLCPVYKSPNDDNGYDISDYHDIMPEFGTLADWEELLAGLHARGIRLVMDLVVNHTSDEHPWFVQSRQSKDNPYRDYYIWRPGKDGREPNNWLSHFGGSAWEFDPRTGEYYLHLFSRKQPDLNWENPQVRREVYRMMRWWLDKGIDGFRMDVINMISKAPGLPDAEPEPGERYAYGGRYFLNGPRLMEFLQEMKREVLQHYDLLTVGETPGVTPEIAAQLTDEQTGVLNMVFQFEHMGLDSEGLKWRVRPWSLLEMKQVMTRWQKGLEARGWNSIYLTNHDQPRAVSRFGDDRRFRVPSAKLLATFTLLLQGTPYIYQGEEIGMTNVAFPSIADYRDIETLNFYREAVEVRGVPPAVALAAIHAKSRDNARTPMQWDSSPNAGFTAGNPWIPVNPNYPEINVQQALADPDSILHYYRRLIRLRKEHPVAVYGRYDLLLADHPQLYVFTRTLEPDRLLVILNFSSEPARFQLPAALPAAGHALLIANYPVDAAEDLRSTTLRPWEARVYRVA
ncbi:MAG: alpha-glucosidase [Anaerolineae bacterium]|nr:alpha-glucosidase [Anaerolineae bacterium]